MMAILVVVALCSTVVPQYPGAKPVPPKWTSGFKTITVEDAQEILGALAGPDFSRPLAPQC
jgi:N-methylhydantoinase A/oxoprolinase/acetone carboxylase beta subunit